MAENQKGTQLFGNFLFPKIFQTFRIAVSLSSLFIAFAAILIISLCGKLMDLGGSVVVAEDGRTNELHIYMQNPSEVSNFIKVNSDSGKRAGVYTTIWRQAAYQFEKAVNNVLTPNFKAAADNVAAYFRAIAWAFKYHFFYSLIFAAVKLVIICIAGGAICRIAALKFTKGEKPGITNALRYSLSKFVSFLAAPLAPIAITAVLSACIIVLGLLGNIPYAGEIIVALGSILALLVGVLIAIVIIGTVSGFGLMFPALAYDGLDCFDSISRSFNYIFSRPWRMGFYTGVATVYGAICYLFVRFFAFLVLLATRFSLGLGLFEKADAKLEAIWPMPTFTNLMATAFESTSGTEFFAAWIIHTFILIILGLIVAFILSFYFSANSIIYALMRKKVDNAPLDEICEGPEPARPVSAISEQAEEIEQDAAEPE
ncbi:MAG: hypothetical protein JW804_04680 [Sedimentisphaerales bacterium]|nr:hypothetical protein [Sedimentisphaerales bacterium]